MRITAMILALAVMAGGCEQRGAPSQENGTAGAAEPGEAESAAGKSSAAGQWDLQSSGEGVALALLERDGSTALRLFCPTGAKRLLVNVPGFRPIGSEERLSFGGGGDAVALVADPRGDPQRGGVTGAGPVPAELPKLIQGPVSASYGAQVSGPHPMPQHQLAASFVSACNDAAAPASDQATASAAGACEMQDGRRLPAIRLKALGNEPFWAARIHGRCVTYLTPENQAGTRIWTRFDGSPDRGSWTGFYENQRFVLRIEPQAGCSDTMSDKRYPLAASLTVSGEERRGCGEPL